MMDCSERGNGNVSTRCVRRNKFGIPATCFAQSGPDLEGKKYNINQKLLSFCFENFCLQSADIIHGRTVRYHLLSCLI